MTIPDEAVQAMPERIYAKTHGASTDVISGQRGLIGGWNEHKRDGQTEFVRADLSLPFLQGEKVDEKQHVDCACTKIQQDETCPVGYPSLLCEICDGKGVAPSSRAQALEEAAQVAEDYVQYDVADAIRLLSSQPVADGWLPIETAPKDGTCVLVWKPDEPRVGEYICVAYWDDSIIKRTPQWVDVAGRGLGYLSKVDNKPQGHPIHWRPLPASPGASE